MKFIELICFVLNNRFQSTDFEEGLLRNSIIGTLLRHRGDYLCMKIVDIAESRFKSKSFQQNIYLFI